MNYYSDNKALQHYLKHPLLQRIVAMKERGYAECGEYNYAPVNFEVIDFNANDYDAMQVYMASLGFTSNLENTVNKIFVMA